MHHIVWSHLVEGSRRRGRTNVGWTDSMKEAVNMCLQELSTRHCAHHSFIGLPGVGVGSTDHNTPWESTKHVWREELQLLSLQSMPEERLSITKDFTLSPCKTEAWWENSFFGQSGKREEWKALGVVSTPKGCTACVLLYVRGNN